jgi:hypothetical protein
MKQKQTTKPLEVDLNVQMNPNKEILLAAYDKADARELFAGDRFMIPAFQNENRIFVASTTSKKPVSHFLFGCYRTKVHNKEYFFAFDHMVTNTHWGSKIDHTRQIGKVDDVPVITATYSINPSRITSDTAMVIPTKDQTTIESTHTEYLWEWEAIKSQLLKWKNANIINDKSNFYIINGNTKTGKFSWDEWFNLSMDDLMLLSRYRDRLGVFTDEQPMTERLATLRKQLQREMVEGKK